MENMETMELELVEDLNNYEVEEEDYVEETNNKFVPGLLIGGLAALAGLGIAKKVKTHIDKKKHEKEVLTAALSVQQPVVENPVQIVDQEPVSVEEAKK